MSKKLNPKAVKEADAAFYKDNPEMAGKKIHPTDPAHKEYRANWWKHYKKAKGNGKLLGKKSKDTSQPCPLAGLKIVILEKISKKQVSNVKIKITGAEQHEGITGANGSAQFSKIKPGLYFIQMEQDEFIIDPTNSSTTVASGIQNKKEILITRQITTIAVKRKHISLKDEDKYGHWWVEIDTNNDGTPDESYGWWPKGPVGSMETLFGTDGELNGQSFFGGTPTLDPHHDDPAPEVFHPLVESGATADEVRNCIRGFANSYSGEWRWTFGLGQNCHTFQEAMMEHCHLRKK